MDAQQWAQFHSVVWLALRTSYHRRAKSSFVSLTSTAGPRWFASVKHMFTLAALWPLFVVPSLLLAKYLSFQCLNG